MDEYEIRQNISNYQQQVNDSNTDIQKLNRDVAKLYELLSNLQGLQMEFETRLYAKRSRLTRLEAYRDINQKLVDRVSDKGRAFLYGNQPDSAFESLDAARGKVNNKINEIEQKIASEKSHISLCEGQINYFNGLLANL